MSEDIQVHAECHSCGDTHPLGDRKRTHGTTRCPACGETPYVSIAVGGIQKSDADRIRDALTDISGVGDQTVEHIVDWFSTYAEFTAATQNELREIKGVGETTAERIASTGK